MYKEPGADPVYLSPLISPPISISIAPSIATAATDQSEFFFQSSDGDDVLNRILPSKPFPTLSSRPVVSPHKRKRQEKLLEVDRPIQRRFTKWHREPLLSRMRAAIIEVRFDDRSSLDVARRMGIPDRTIRRYVSVSKDPSRSESLFYMDKDPRVSSVC